MNAMEEVEIGTGNTGDAEAIFSRRVDEVHKRLRT